MRRFPTANLYWWFSIGFENVLKILFLIIWLTEKKYVNIDGLVKSQAASHCEERSDEAI